MTYLLFGILAVLSSIAFITGANILFRIDRCKKHKIKITSYSTVLLSMIGIVSSIVILIDDNLKIGFDHDLYEIFHASFNMIVFIMFHIDILRNKKCECKY